MLDTWHLEIEAVTREDGTDLPYELGDHDPVLGQALTVHVGDADRVVVRYATTAGARALQWLEPEQTASGQPFLFTQSQAILARSWIPCQDSPACASPTTPPCAVPARPAGGDERREPGRAGARTASYRFAMPQPIPPYLIALAVGDLAFRADRRRARGVYAEPAVVEQAAWEFADVEEMIDAAEALFGPYRWGRYDMLVLPPSFPYGGMENPRLTFVTPTLLAGDRSLVTWSPTSWRTPGRATWSPTRRWNTSGSTRASPSTSRPASSRSSTARRSPGCCSGWAVSSSTMPWPRPTRATPGWSSTAPARTPTDPSTVPYEKG